MNFTCAAGGLANIFTVIGDWDGANQILTVWRDGTMVGSASNVDPDRLVYANAALGNFNNGDGKYKGDLNEVILYNRALTSNEFQRVGGYLATKYGLATAFKIPAPLGTVIMIR